jgi:hypothetical protein
VMSTHQDFIFCKMSENVRKFLKWVQINIPTKSFRRKTQEKSAKYEKFRILKLA